MLAGAASQQPAMKLAERSAFGGRHIRQIDVDRLAFADPVQESLERGREIENAPHKQAQPLEQQGIGGLQRIVGAVKGSPSFLEPSEDFAQRRRLRRRVRRPVEQRARVNEVVARALQLADKPVERLCEAGRLPDGLEVAVMLAGDLGQ
jgi:hypothetical protein